MAPGGGQHQCVVFYRTLSFLSEYDGGSGRREATPDDKGQAAKFIIVQICFEASQEHRSERLTCDMVQVNDFIIRDMAK